MMKTRPLSLLVACSLCSILYSGEEVDKDPADALRPQLSLQDVESVKLPDVTIESAKHFKAGQNGADVDHVQVVGKIGGKIGFALLMPDQWNGRFVMGGGGLFVGRIQNHARGSVNNGYATVGTDTGHESASVFKADWAYLDLEAQLNFGYLAVHRTAEVSRALIRLYYGRDAEYSYLMGCSTGGRQGLMEAARFPDDFDGIVAGCPVANKTGLYATFVQQVQTFFPIPERAAGPRFTEEQMADFHRQVLSQCDGRDGLEDGIINNPLACQVDWSQIVGLNEWQKAALRSVYEGPRVRGESLYPGLPVGSESRWYRWFVGADPDFAAIDRSISALGFACTEFGRYLVFDDPEWNPAKYDLANWWRDTRRASKILDCTNPGLGPFHDSGGKLIIWHSWADGGLTARASIEYFEEVKDPSKDEFLRLYLLPGVHHCGGGPGPSEIDWLQVISDWVERSSAPDRLVAKKRNDEGMIVIERPIYPYPVTVRYKGTGDPNDAGSFEPDERSHTNPMSD